MSSAPLSPPALLPAGLPDLLPPEAEREAIIEAALMHRFNQFGYRRVKPPMVEFEETVKGGALDRQSFRVMDPASRRMMALRADQTLQIARIAETRLIRAARPLRLSYAGEVLRVTGSQLRPERQFRQVGAELIGSLSPGGDAEIILMAASALAGLGVSGLSADLNLPTLADTLFAAHRTPPDQQARLRAMLDQRDMAALQGAGPVGQVLAALVDVTGLASSGLESLRSLDLPPAATADIDRLAHVVTAVAAALPEVTLTLDPVEWRGFEYQSGLSFTLFARGVRGELGRGGRYRAGGPAGDPGSGEPATGVTLYLDSLMRAIPAPADDRRLLVPATLDHAALEALRAEGWQTVMALDGAVDAAAAQAQACAALWHDGHISPLSP